MRRDDADASPRLANARELAHEGDQVGDVLDDVVEMDRARRAVGKRQAVDVGNHIDTAGTILVHPHKARQALVAAAEIHLHRRSLTRKRPARKEETIISYRSLTFAARTEVGLLNRAANVRER